MNVLERHQWILDQLGSKYPLGMTPADLDAAGYRGSPKDRSNDLYALKRKGLIDLDGTRYVLTTAPESYNQQLSAEMADKPLPKPAAQAKANAEPKPAPAPVAAPATAETIQPVIKVEPLDDIPTMATTAKPAARPNWMLDADTRTALADMQKAMTRAAIRIDNLNGKLELLSALQDMSPDIIKAGLKAIADDLRRAAA